MRNERAIISEGMKYLVEKLSIVEAEYFVFAIKRDAFDYTELRERYFGDAYMDGNGTQLENFIDTAARHFPQPSFGQTDLQTQ